MFLILCLPAAIVVSVYIIKLHEKIERLSKEKTKLFDLSSDLADRLIKATARINEVESAVEKGFGVKVRNEVTVIKCEFNKLEMVILLSGVHKLFKDSKSVEDTKVYMTLIDKINSNLPLMKEDVK
jgi:hypothetical protein